MKKLTTSKKNILNFSAIVILFGICFIYFHLIQNNSNSIKMIHNQWAFDNNDGYSIHYQSIVDHYRDLNRNNIIVAVIDTGIDISHHSLKKSIWQNQKEIENGIDDDNNGFIDDLHGWNFYDNNNILYEEINSHGTAVAGIISSINHIDSINDTNIKIMCLKVLGPTGTTNSLFSIIQAIKYAEMNGAQICNLSFNTTEYSSELEEVIKQSEMLFIVSAGNGDKKGNNIDYKKRYPSSFNCENIIVVASATPKGLLDVQSNYGKTSVHIAAPGVNIFSLAINNQFNYFSGTSFAAPFVSGIAALITSADPELSSVEIKNILLNSSYQSKYLKKYIMNGNLLDGKYIINQTNYRKE